MIMVDVLLHVFSQIYTSVKDILINVNNNLAPRIDTTLFVTMLLFGWDIRQQKLTYASAGHEHIILYHANTGQCEDIKSGGIALGMALDISQIAEEKTLNLEDGDAVIIYTDGVTEAKNTRGELFGLRHLTETINQFGYRGAQGIFDGVTKTLSNYISEEVQHDDMTLIVMKYKHTTPEEIERRVRKARLSIKEQLLKRKQKAVWDWEKA
jgi:serine phosphatase RsbU (regulator of sigma subunit)